MNKSDRRKAAKPEYGSDLISNLPDHILLPIISGLLSTEEIIRTSVFVQTMEVSVDFSSLSRLTMSPRMEALRKIEKTADSKNLFIGMSTVERWIHAAVMRNVKQLDLSFGSMEKSEDMVMPHCLVITCASLEEATIDPELNATPVVYWNFSCGIFDD
ncbi:hypothetical protein LXL04_003235 [Taraxacum kok-saghyz]